MTSIYGYSATAASNNSSAPDGAPENMAPSGVNDTIRKVMANLAEFAIAQVAGGTADALTLTPTNTLAAYVDGMQVHFRATAANTTATPTLAISGLTARTIVKNGGSALVAGDIAGALAEYIVRYNLANTRWELLNPATATVSGTLAVNKGGTGLATLTDKNLLVGAGTSNVTFVAPGTSGNVLTSDGTSWASSAPAIVQSTGTWTPADASGATLSFTSVNASYTKIGNMVFAYGTFTYPSTANGSNSLVSGLPFTCANTDGAQQGILSYIGMAGATATKSLVLKNSQTFGFYTSAGAAVTNANMTLAQVNVMLIYPVA